MTLAASEDKTHRGAYVASPSMPWAFGQGLEKPSSVYHLVWSRDLYQIATGLLAAGDSGGAGRSLDFLFDKQQTPDGCFPQNSNLDGSKRWENLQLDEVALPIVLAWQLGRARCRRPSERQARGRLHPREGSADRRRSAGRTRAAGHPPRSPPRSRRWCARADLARANGDPAAAAAWEAKADEWQARSTAGRRRRTAPTPPGPTTCASASDGDPNEGTTYDIGDAGPTEVDQRKVIDPSFLELVRLGVKRADHPLVLNTLGVVDRRLAVDTPARPLLAPLRLRRLRREEDGSRWDVDLPTNPTEDRRRTSTIGRIWPIFAGERGEYELAAGQSAAARARLAAMASAGGPGHMIPEQVWDQFRPSGIHGFPKGLETTLRPRR